MCGSLFPFWSPLDQVRSRLRSMTGIMPLYFDMCVKACMAFTGAFRKLLKSIFCGEDRYKSVAHSDKPSSTPCHQFVTLPIGPQLQALWRHLLGAMQGTEWHIRKHYI